MYHAECTAVVSMLGDQSLYISIMRMKNQHRHSKSAVGKTRHVSDTWKCGSLSFIFTHPPEDLSKKKKKKKRVERTAKVIPDGLETKHVTG